MCPWPEKIKLMSSEMHTKRASPSSSTILKIESAINNHKVRPKHRESHFSESKKIQVDK